MSASEAVASREFLQALITQLRRNGADAQEAERVIEHLVPVLVPGIIHLLKAASENQQREHDGEQHVLPIKPLDHLAKFLFRHNPRHAKPDSATLELQELARHLLRK
ncbi:hypothetical protein PybrP1_004729 [[Pythium] brassicae (nom. inval.)]|nr:hypothetical protein PybrP1_004729 [[Pythium] brassicae (nom. inval.)]